MKASAKDEHNKQNFGNGNSAPVTMTTRTTTGLYIRCGIQLVRRLESESSFDGWPPRKYYKSRGQHFNDRQRT